LSDVDLAAELQRRHSLSRAVRGEKRVASAADRLAVDGSRFANDADEAARMIQRDFGPDSLVTRGAQGVLAVASAAERGTQIPLDRINAVADALVEAGRQAFGAPSLPALRFRSHVGHEQAGVRLSASW
jgi:hypothetical protein